MAVTAPTPLESLAQQIARQQAELEGLRREYETRQTSLTDLKRQKETLQAQLRQIEADIRATIQGSPPRAAPAPQPTRQLKPSAPQPRTMPGKKATGPKPLKALRKNSLPALLVKIVGKSSTPLTVKQLTAEVVRRKYPTTSGNISAMVDTRVRELAKKGLIQNAPDHPGFVLAYAPVGKTTPPSKARSKNGAIAGKVAPPAKTDGQPLPLRVLLTDLLAKSRQPLSARELAQQLLASGHQTKSKNFVNVLWVALGQMNNVRHVAGKGYILKKT